jgi:hypothetical protein
MNLKTIWLIIMIAAGIMAAGSVIALMPPHVDGTVPDNHGIIKGDTVVLHGYSLGYAATEKVQVLDVATGKFTPIRRNLECRWEGEGDCPGCRQQACTFTIKLLAPVPGHTYEFRFLEETYRYTVGPKKDSKP